MFPESEDETIMPDNILYFILGLFAFGAVLIKIAPLRNRVDSERQINDWVKYGSYLVLIVGMILLAGAGRFYLAIVLGIVALAGTIELNNNLHCHKCLSLAISLLFGAVIALFLGHLILSPAGRWYDLFVYMFLTVAATDSYAQLWGKLLGRKKLCPHLSPGKTVEGMIGGIGTAVVCSGLLSWLLSLYSFPASLIPGGIVALSAIAGDLLFSAIKRGLEIKDFSGLIPGHGGVLDRFDSLIIAAPVFYWTMKIFQF